MILIGLKNCSNCREIEKILKSKNIEYEYREIDKDTPAAEELKGLHKKSGLPIDKFFNTAGQVYKSLGLKDKISKMTDEEKYKNLSSDGMLIKRPILVTKDKVIVGNDVKGYLEGI
ncbi:MAG: Spx/MgsR family RNA polymerase-binding regulatory protein [Clostridiaceae bacterium]